MGVSVRLMLMLSLRLIPTTTMDTPVWDMAEVFMVSERLMLMLSLRPIPTTTMDTLGWVTTVLDTLALAAWVTEESDTAPLDTDPTVPWDTGTSDTGLLDTGTTDTLDRQKILPNCLTGSLIVPKNYKILLDAFRYPFRILRK